MTDITMVDALSVKPLSGARLSLRFSDGSEGVFDLSDYIATGGDMVKPLADPEFFNRVFLEMGAPTWPNGFDLDPIALHMELREAGLLKMATAAAEYLS